MTKTLKDMLVTQEQAREYMRMLHMKQQENLAANAKLMPVISKGKAKRKRKQKLWGADKDTYNRFKNEKISCMTSIVCEAKLNGAAYKKIRFEKPIEKGTFNKRFSEK
jgi:hypothetical protein